MKKIILLAFLTFTAFAGAYAQRFAYVDSDYILKHMPEYASSQKQLALYLINGKKRLMAVSRKLTACTKPTRPTRC
jgi:Skp family chaperone for outer membrane proteins